MTLLSHCSLLIGNMGSAFRLRNDLEGKNNIRFYSAEDIYLKSPRKLPGFINGNMSYHYNVPEFMMKDLSKTKEHYHPNTPTHG